MRKKATHHQPPLNSWKEEDGKFLDRLSVCLSVWRRERERAGQLDWGYNEKRQTGKETKINGVNKLLLLVLTGAELLLLTTRYLNQVCAQDLREKLESQIATAKKSPINASQVAWDFHAVFFIKDWFLHQSERSRKWDQTAINPNPFSFWLLFCCFIEEEEERRKKKKKQKNEAVKSLGRVSK